jgi:riboflavin kinase/FMN adenylyltransferase
VWVTSSLTTILTPTAVALGNFDGVHLGHRQVIQPVLPSEEAHVGDEHLHPTVVTFHPHPQEFFSGQPRYLLTPLSEKSTLLKAMGIEQVILLPFNKELATLTPEEFVEKVLVQKLQAKRVSVGLDFCFGQQRAGTAADLQAIAATYGIKVAIAPLRNLEGERISSSAIRQALQAGNLQTANRLLGRSYSLVGNVTQGQQLGRTIGFPTANLQLPPEKFLPRLGVYAVRVHLHEGESNSSITAGPALGVMNVGFRPTVDGKTQVVEVHLFDWAEDLYGRTLMVSLEKFLRPEQKFASLTDLKAQIQADSTSAKAFFAEVK